MPSTHSSFAHKADRALYWSFAALFFFLPIGTSPAVIAGILVLSIWILSGKFITERQRYMGEIWFRPLAFFILLPWVGLLWTSDFQEGMRFASKTYYFLLAFALASVRASERDSVILLQAFVAGLTVAAVCSLLQVAEVLPGRNGIPSLVGTKRILGGLFLVFGVCLLLAYLRDCRRADLRFVFVSLIALFFMTLGMTGARSGYLGLAVVIPFLYVYFFRRISVIRIAGFLALLLILLAAFGPFRDRVHSIQSEIQRFEHGDANSAVGERLHMWKGALVVISENPLFGTGTGGYRQGMKRFENESIAARDINNPHSSFFYMACSFGIFGLVVLVWYFAPQRLDGEAFSCRAGGSLLRGSCGCSQFHINSHYRFCNSESSCADDRNPGAEQ